MKNRFKIHLKIRKTVNGSAKRPRLAIYRSLNNIFAQAIDDNAGKTLFSVSSLKMSGNNSMKAKLVGAQVAKIAKDLKITQVVFDRGGFPYRGTIKILAETVRENGLLI